LKRKIYSTSKFFLCCKPHGSKYVYIDRVKVHHVNDYVLPSTIADAYRVSKSFMFREGEWFSA